MLLKIFEAFVLDLLILIAKFSTENGSLHHKTVHRLLIDSLLCTAVPGYPYYLGSSNIY